MTVKLLNCDCMKYLSTCESEKFDLIIVDPPYFEVKGDFDFIWPDFESYLTAVDDWAKECQRVLKKNGSLFWWGHAEKIAYSQVIIDKYLTIENSMTWEKVDSMQFQYYSPDLARRFNTHNERLLFYSNNWEPDGWQKTGLERIHEEHIKPNHPFAIYMRSEFKRAGVTNKKISALFPSKTGGLTGCVSNWLNGDNVPTREQYEKIRKFLNGDYLRKEYDYLRKEYEDLRRPFNNVQKLTDVLRYSQESSVTAKHKHPTQKPPKLCRAIIAATMRKGGEAFVPFLGSFVEAIECHNLGMNVTGCELEPKYYTRGMERFKKETRQIDMFGGNE